MQRQTAGAAVAAALCGIDTEQGGSCLSKILTGSVAQELRGRPEDGRVAGETRVQVICGTCYLHFKLGQQNTIQAAAERVYIIIACAIAAQWVELKIICSRRSLSYWAWFLAATAAFAARNFSFTIANVLYHYPYFSLVEPAPRRVLSCCVCQHAVPRKCISQKSRCRLAHGDLHTHVLVNCKLPTSPQYWSIIHGKCIIRRLCLVAWHLRRPGVVSKSVASPDPAGFVWRNPVVRQWHTRRCSLPRSTSSARKS